MTMTDYNLLMDKLDEVVQSIVQLKDEIDKNEVGAETDIVHCVECEHLGIKDLCYGYCKRSNGGMNGILNPKDFCSDGIRKKGKKKNG